MKVFHTSPNTISNINKLGAFGECLCFSDHVYEMSSCDTVTYSIELHEDDIIEAHTFFYRDDYKKLDDIIESIMDLASCDRDTAEELLSQKDQVGNAEIDWRIQGYSGEAAKILGYRACEATDEQGAVYIVPMLGNESKLKLEGS